MNNPRTRRILTFVLPILSIAVSIFTVTNQYARKARLIRELAVEEKEYAMLQRSLPKEMRAAGSPDKHDHDHHHHED
jgi:hypothetical protein